MTNKNYQTLRDLILKSEGKTLEDELEFGCYVFWGEEKTIVSWRNLKRYGLGGIGGEFFTDKLEKNKIVILGLPITLERVLRALDQKFNSKELQEEGENIIYSAFSDGAIGTLGSLFREERISWQLCKPAHEQSDETIEGLIGLLTNK